MLYQYPKFNDKATCKIELKSRKYALNIEDLNKAGYISILVNICSPILVIGIPSILVKVLQSALQEILCKGVVERLI